MAETINADHATAEPAVAPANAATAFMAQLLSGETPPPAPNTAAAHPGMPPIVPQPEPQPATPAQPPVVVAPPVQPLVVAMPPVQPPAPPVPQSPVVAPPPPPAPLDFMQRYAPAGSQPQLDLTPLPDLPPEPQIPQTQDGQQIPNAAFAAMRSGYGQMRHMADDFRNKYNRLVEDTKKFQGEKAEFATQLNAKDEQIRKLQDEIGRMDLARSPEFQEKYDAPIRTATDEVTQLLLANGMQQNEAVELAREIITSDPQTIPERITNLPTYVQGQIMVKATAADKLWGARTQALEEWKQSAEGLAAVAARGSAVIDAQRVSQLADSAISLIKGLPPEKGLPPSFQVTDPAFVADRDAKEQQFRAWVQQAPEDQKMAAMFEGFMAPKTYEMVDNVFRENLQLKQMLYARTRVDAPPISAMRMPQPNLQPGVVAPPSQPQPQQAPSIQQNGWSFADVGSSAQSFAQQLMDNMRGQRNLPVV